MLLEVAGARAVFFAGTSWFSRGGPSLEHGGSLCGFGKPRVYRAGSMGGQSGATPRAVIFRLSDFRRF